MKTVIATLIVSIATATSAFAFDTNQFGVPASLIKDYSATEVQVSGFTGIAGGHANMVDLKQNGIPASLVKDCSATGVQDSGFVGNAGGYSNVGDLKDNGIPASLR